MAQAVDGGLLGTNGTHGGHPATPTGTGVAIALRAEGAIGHEPVEHLSGAGDGHEIAVTTNRPTDTTRHEVSTEVEHGLDVPLGGLLVAAEHQRHRVPLLVSGVGPLRGLGPGEPAVSEHFAVPTRSPAVAQVRPAVGVHVVAAHPLPVGDAVRVGAQTGSGPVVVDDQTSGGRGSRGAGSAPAEVGTRPKDQIVPFVKIGICARWGAA